VTTDSSGPSPSTSVGGGDAEAELWQHTLATEHAVIWGFGVLGAVPGFADAAEAELRVHRERRITCVDAIVELDRDPVPSAPAYDVPRPSDVAAARRLGADLDAAASAAYAGLAGATARSTRLLAARWLRESAIAQTAWDGVIPGLPGLEQS
jgi:hypothetical protein